MGPRSDNRGYVPAVRTILLGPRQLQWVHGPITVVMIDWTYMWYMYGLSSMGLRSDNRGYASRLEWMILTGVTFSLARGALLFCAEMLMFITVHGCYSFTALRFQYARACDDT